MDPASRLFILSQVLIALGIPLAGCALSWGRNRRAVVWFGAGVFYSFYVMLVALRPYGFVVAYVLPPFILFSYLAILIDTLRQDLGEKSQIWLFLVLAFLCGGINALLMSGGPHVNGWSAQVFLTVCVIMAHAMIAVCGLRCARLHASRSMYILTGAVILIILASVVRLYALLIGSAPFSLLAFDRKATLLIVAHLLAIIFVNAGYAGFNLEQSVRAGALARESQKAAEDRSRELAETVRERDLMIMLNSRFAAMSGLAFFYVSHHS